MTNSLGKDSEYCECMDKRKFGFTNVGERGAPWWVCANCMLPTRPYAEAMGSKESDRGH